ncbi:MAG: phage head closure protein [Oscillospiraceae bacterium]|nr:phage head closure protein [Oscillospiraceae bacterium]
MEIGKMNQRITVLEHHTKVDSIGNHKTQWEEVFSCWAYVSMRNSVNSSIEKTEAGVTKEVQSLEFTIRQTADTVNLSTTTHRIQFREIQYDLVSIVPNFTSQDYMKLTCEIRKAGAKDALN